MKESKKIIKEVLERLGKNIKKKNGLYVSSSDKLSYRLMKLENGLQIVLIQNKDTNIGSACMSVDVGSLDDTPGIDGMAHYLEHMLFMGSDMFPGGSYFLTQISNNGGMTNAFTADDMTQYYFECSENFMDLLQIFSRFFVSPSFDLKYVEKEVSAVDSEHKKNIGSDGWRIGNLSKQFFTNEIYRRFSTGTRESILGACKNDPNILRKELIKFYERNYSSDRMILFICYRDIDEVTIKTIKTMFEPIKMRENKHEMIKEEPEVNELNGKYEIIKILTTCGNNQLTIKWLISGIATQGYQNNVCVDSYDVLNHILGHESKGSLHHILTDAGLIVGLSAGIERNYETKCIYSLYLDLTQKGMENWENILYLVNNYINNLKMKNKESAQMFDQFMAEMEALNLINLKTIVNINGLQLSQHYVDIIKNRKLDVKYVTIAPVLTGPPDVRRKHFMKVLEQLIFENMKIIVSSSLFDNNEMNLVDVNYGTKYAYEQQNIDDKLVQKIKRQFNESQIQQYPVANKYIPQIEKIKKINPIEKDNNDYYSLKSDTGNIYYLKKGNTYNTYNMHGIIEITVSAMEIYDPVMYIIISMYITYIDKIMRSEIFMLLMMSTMMSIYVNRNELTLVYDGYCDKLEKIFLEIMKWYFVNDREMEHLNRIDKNIYEMIYHDMMIDLVNYNYSDAYTMIGPEFKKMVNSEHTISNEELIDALKTISPEHMNNLQSKINYENFREFTINAITKGQVIGVMGGSVKINQARKITEIIDTLIKRPKNFSKPKDEKYKNEGLSFPKKKIVQNTNPHNSERAIGYGMWIGGNYNNKEIFSSLKDEDNNDILKSLCKILDTYISDKFTSLMRTEREVGYIAMCTTINVNEPINPDYFLLFIIQSTRDDLETIIEDYIDNYMMNDINSMTEEEFNFLKHSMITHLSEKALNINTDVIEMFGELKYKIMNNNNLVKSLSETEKMSQKQITISKLKQIERKDFTKFVKTIFDRNIRSIVIIDPMKRKNTKN